ncbi:MAG: putative DNA-binding domain-containing protein [Planctomycetota bacterium]
MSEFLERFHRGMADYIWDSPDDPSPLQAAFPGWEVNAERLAIYGDFISWYVRDCLQLLFPRTRRVMGEEAWLAAVADYYRTRPSRHYEINVLGQGFPEWLAEREGLHPAVPQVATFELTIHEIYASETELLAEEGAEPEPCVNPTLQTVELAFEVCDWAREAGREGEGPLDPPPAGAELALLWRNRRLLVSYAAATPRTLLALKVSLEGIPLADAAAAGGVSEDEVRAALDEQVERGLLLRS